MNSIDWPDIAIGVILLGAVIKGWSRGFVAELAGIVALVAGFIAPWWYNGALDAQIATAAHISAGQAHVAGMVLTGIAAYVAVLVAASIVGRIAKLPIIGTGNALGGAIVGFVKGAAIVWVLLFVALCFPLTPQVREQLRTAHLPGYFTAFDDTAGNAIQRYVPSFAQPLVAPLVRPHDL
ncbi:MAG TPA: CvpA family protein [Candidatus Tumulicola sp.]